MELGPNDLHYVFAEAANHCSGWNAQHEQVFSAEARNAAIGGEGTGHFAECPAGTFLIGKPVTKNTPPFGPFFLPLIELPGHHEFDAKNRAGIGLHAGGSGLQDPFARRQGWVKTEGCIRFQTEDLLALVKLVNTAAAAGGKAYFTVIRG